MEIVVPGLAAVPGVGMGWSLSKIRVATVAHLAAKVIQHFDIYLHPVAAKNNVCSCFRCSWRPSILPILWRWKCHTVIRVIWVTCPLSPLFRAAQGISRQPWDPMRVSATMVHADLVVTLRFFGWGPSARNSIRPPTPK